MSDSIQLYLGDCIEVMSQIPDESVDCVICDLPYGTTNCKWDIIIPFEDLWKEYHRIIKPNSPIILFGSQPFTSLMISSNIKEYKEELIWVKNKAASGLMANKRHLKYHENIIVFCKDNNYTYNPIVWNVPEDFIIKRKVNEIITETNNIIGMQKKGRIRKIDDGTRSPISILPFQVPYSPKSKSKTKNGDYRVHPTQKPIALLYYLVQTYSNQGDLVLDNCMGSGTTGLACKKFGRNFIGIEKDCNYFEVAKERIENG